MRILIIDDEPGSAQGLQWILEDQGYQVDVAPSAAAAIRLCNEHDYGVLFLDLGLPDRHGIDLLPDLRKLCPQGQILVLTADQSIDRAVEAVNHGASFYILKPIENYPTVVRMVRRVEEDLERQQQIEFQSLVLDNVQESVVAVDMNERVIYWNHGAQNLYGWVRDDMIGQPLTVPRGVGLQILGDLPADGAARIQESIVRRKDGAFIDVEERIHAFVDRDGRPLGYLLLSRDITERKQIERARQETAEREHRIALTFQKALLPVLASHRPGLEIGNLYAPAWAEEGVGGDFFDLLSLSDNRTGMMLGDVSGKGVTAGVLMGVIRDVINAYADEDDRPGEVLLRTNRHLAPRVPDERFVTLFYGTYDPEAKEIAYASAGHEPAILRRVDGTVELLQATGPMVGLEADMDFEALTVPFHDGDLLLLYTDGATEIGAPEDFLGTEGLTKLLEEVAHLPVQELVDRLHEALLEKCDGIAQDDLALLCLRADYRIP